MIRNSTYIGGAKGALPVWIRMAEALIHDKDYAGKLDMIDLVFTGLSEVPLEYPALGQIKIPVDKKSGIARSEAFEESDAVDRTSIVTFGKINRDGTVQPDRYFSPFWHSSSYVFDKPSGKA